MTFTIFRLSDGERTEIGLAEVPADLGTELFGWRPEPSVNPEHYIWDASVPGYMDVAPPPVPPRNLTRLEFQLLFTRAERTAIRASTDPRVIDDLALQVAASDIVLAHPLIIDGTEYLEAIGLIGPGRAAHILAGDLPPVGDD